MDSSLPGRCVRERRLCRMKTIMDRLENPQNSFKSVHIAGSKGKGSTAAYIASGIHALGIKTGLYLSPHVSDYRERFTVNGQFVSDKSLIEVGNELYEKLKDLKFSEDLGEERPTTFELYTSFAFLLFKHEKCEWAVIETGLGGRLDATNVITPKASVLTPIELEHTELLGNTLNLIAGEKSKIIKDNVPSFVSYQKSEAMNVFENEACLKHSVLTKLENQIKTLQTESTENCQKTTIEFNDGLKSELNLKMQGSVQAYNCALALCVLRHLDLYRKGTTEKALENTVLPGRMEKITWKRTLYVDGAHTENSINQLVSSFSEINKGKNSICIFGCLADKNAEAMGKIILKNFNTVIISKPGTYKKNNPRELFELFDSMKNENNRIYLIEDILKALDFCTENTTEETAILVCGSFYLVGELKEKLCH